jgi:hypothetical protein
MSFKCVFKLDNNEFNVLNFDISFDRPIDNFKRPAGLIRGCTIDFTVETSSNVALFSWFSTQFQTKNGTFTFMQRDSEQKMREVEFTDGYIIKYNENFSSFGDNPFVINILVSCNEVRIQSAMISNFWPEDN